MRSVLITVTTGSRAQVRDLTAECAAFVLDVLPAFVAPSITVPVLAGHLQLGTWQSICLVDTNTDNPEREVRLSFLPG